MSSSVYRRFVFLFLSECLAKRAVQNDQRIVQPKLEGLGSGCKGTVPRPVKVLVTRHGLSCANLIDKFSAGTISKFMHINMKDPLLSAAGVLMTQTAAGEFSNWLKDNPTMKPDAVLASHLARAWSTAAFQYPGYTKQIEGVPFISESGAGKDNQPNDMFEQFSLVRAQVEPEFQRSGTNASFKINLEWLRKHGQKTKGDWNRFREFLAEEYLPNFVTKTSKGEKEPIVLAAVTHSNFMAEKEIKAKCYKKYPIDHKSGKRKANNNQVMLIPYLWQSITCGPPGRNQTIMHTLLDDKLDNSEQCLSVATGTSVYDDAGNLKPLCKKDLGERCMQEFSDASAWVVPTIEDHMKTEDSSYQTRMKKLHDLDLKLPELSMASGAINKQTDPRMYQAAEKALQANRKAKTKLHNEMLKIETAYADLKAEKCWLGGNPDYKSTYLN